MNPLDQLPHRMVVTCGVRLVNGIRATAWLLLPIEHDLGTEVVELFQHSSNNTADLRVAVNVLRRQERSALLFPVCNFQPPRRDLGFNLCF